MQFSPRPHSEFGVRTFDGESGQTYLVFKTPKGQKGEDRFHVFTEVEAKQAARDCGADVEAHTNEMWKQVWDEAD